jgi:hypothetical protein
MLRVYKRIDHKIFRVQDLLKFLVEEVFCKADRQICYTKLKGNSILKKLYENDDSDWFKTQTENIYKQCKKLTDDEKDILREVFERNNEIEYLCNNPSKRKPLTLLSSKISKSIIDFFKEIYDRLLEWVDIKNEYGTKKEYYDDLIWENGFNACPCCGFGNIKTVYDRGHSAFDHYLSIMYYPFSVANFNNLFPLCTDCNSGAKSSSDILKKNKKVFFPFSSIHPEITFEANVDSKNLFKFLAKVKKEERINDNDLKLTIQCDVVYKEQIESWDDIFGINQRYFGQIATNAIAWMDDVRGKRRESGKPLQECFDAIIRDDSNKPLGFLKSPFLSELKKYNSLIEAIEEVSGSSKI